MAEGRGQNLPEQESGLDQHSHSLLGHFWAIRPSLPLLTTWQGCSLVLPLCVSVWGSEWAGFFSQIP